MFLLRRFALQSRVFFLHYNRSTAEVQGERWFYQNVMTLTIECLRVQIVFALFFFGPKITVTPINHTHSL